MQRNEKIEVRKGNVVYIYTGILKEYDKENVVINTIKGETVIFRKEQIEGRKLVQNENK